MQRLPMACPKIAVCSWTTFAQAAKESGEKNREQLAAELERSKLDLAELRAGT